MFCGVGASIILASASCVGWKEPPPPEGGPEEVCGGLGGGILRDELQKTENIVKIKEVIVHDSRDDEEDDKDDFTLLRRQPEKHG